MTIAHSISRPVAHAIARGLTERVGLPAWASGMDLWRDFAADRGNLAQPTDTHAQPIYAQNSAGVWLPFAADQLVRTDLGVQTSPTVQNGVPNCAGAGAVVGAPGTPPTGWDMATPQFTNVVREIVGQGTDPTTGLPYTDVKYSGTPIGTGMMSLNNQATNSGPAAVSGQTWNASTYIALVGGSFANISSANLSLVERSVAFAGLNSSAVSFLAASATPQRFQVTRLLTNVLSTNVSQVVAIGVTNGLSVNFTLRFIGAQIEQNGFASPPIITSGAAATTAGNQPVITGLGTMLTGGVAGFIQADLRDVVNQYRAILEITNAGNGDRLRLFNFNGTGYSLQRYVGGVYQDEATPGEALTVGVNTFAFASAPGFLRVRRLGGAQASGVGALHPTMDRTGLGGTGTDNLANMLQFTKKLALKGGAQDQSSFDAMVARMYLAA